jgi:crossover junction endodeoxyribonuclease RuvC
MVILAIDPGIEKVGYSLFEKKVNGKITFTYLTSGLIKTNKTTIHEKRLNEIYDHLATLIDLHKPELIVFEQLFFFKNAKTVISVAQAQGVIQLLASQKNIPMKMFTPLQIKQIITGYGNSDKKSVHKMLQLLLKQDLNVKDDDESDAIACGLAYCYVNERLQ